MRRADAFRAAPLALLLVVAACGLAGTAPAPCRGSVPAMDPNQRSHHDPELEGRIAAAMGGDVRGLMSVCAEVADLGGFNATPEFLADVGVELADVSYATVVPGIGGDLEMQVSASRYHSAGESDIRDALLDTLAGMGEPTRDVEVEGRTAHVGDGPLTAGTTMLVADDTMYFLSGAEEQVAAFVAGLP